ncbi:trp operon leader peptide [Enterobacter ludwigii]|uniref:trp operon leader peptide n=8 Tax=Enterobacteriaceae TaxID=543 RepID=A0A2T4Y480_ENTCL|nr:trp operon leader peptide [Leclercia sp. W6]AYY08156.1 trp operon leader peptide [Enterobacter roggenkampii]AZL49666.1 trp operon leader peptide [Enterobacter sp. SGAir0187]AZV07862.1 trp operon leader peptide [Enterobacter sp. N18-03635]EGQ5293795.1 trp operon leader peptide [Enterobacter cloacae]EGQ5318611.1 trp operon leader peptide [Enterobacter asburiae]EHF8261396.1 trp operon leader peptide [Enterobacter kobei]EHN8829412.1 trp operon leader peptide [Enterobacter bugandensis]EKS6730
MTAHFTLHGWWRTS